MAYLVRVEASRLNGITIYSKYKLNSLTQHLALQLPVLLYCGSQLSPTPTLLVVVVFVATLPSYENPYGGGVSGVILAHYMLSSLKKNIRNLIANSLSD